MFNVNNFKMSQENGFFATQIAQNGVEPSELESPEAPPVIEKEEESVHSLKNLLTAFNACDREQKGLIPLSEVGGILTARGLSSENVAEYHQMSLPIFEDMISFDEFLFVYALSQQSASSVEEKYALCRTVDPRLIDFLKLLNNYRKKCEKNGSYPQARNSKRKIEEIRQRQLLRRNKYLRLLYDRELESTESAQRSKFQQFCSKWDHFMNQYEATAADLVKKVREKQAEQLKEYQQKTKEELAAKMHYSKYLLQLQLKEKNLVKVQEYDKAALVQAEIQQVKARELRQKEIADLEVVELRLKAFRKQQEAVVSTLLQKIQKDRNDHLKQRQNQTEKMTVRSKAQLTDIDHRYNDTLKRIHEALHNLGLESQKNIKLKK